MLEEPLILDGQRRLDQLQRGTDIAAPVFAGLRHRLADLAEGGEMHHRHRLVAGEDLIQPRAVGQAAFFERAEFHRIAPAGDQAVIGDRQIAGQFQRLAGM